MEPEIQSNIKALQELLDLLDAYDHELYCDAPMPGASPIGKHVRHVIDHYKAFIEGCQCGVIDYDRRSRDCAMESCQNDATRHALSCRQFLSTLAADDNPVMIFSTVCAETQTVSQVPSTLQRELVYLLNHTVHHVAYMSLLSKIQGIRMTREIGVAPATQVALSDAQRCKDAEEHSTMRRLAS